MSKHKSVSQNPIVYWWNEFLFARYYEYETELSPQELADELYTLTHPRQGWVWGLEKAVKTTLHPNEKGLDFNVVSKRKRLLDPIGITTASTHGTAEVDSATGNTIVTGSVKLGRFFHIFLLIYFAFILAVYLPLVFTYGNSAANAGGAGVAGMVLPMLVLAIAFGGLWWRIYNDRNRLAELIREVVYTEKAKRSSERLAENEMQNNGWQGEESQQNTTSKRL
jgi:hypothetical protein